MKTKGCGRPQQRECVALSQCGQASIHAPLIVATAATPNEMWPVKARCTGVPSFSIVHSLPGTESHQVAGLRLSSMTATPHRPLLRQTGATVPVGEYAI